MDITKIFKVLVSVTIFVVLLSIMAPGMKVPEMTDDMMSDFPWALTLIALAWTVLYGLSLILLLIFQKSGKLLFTVAIISGFLLRIFGQEDLYLGMDDLYMFGRIGYHEAFIWVGGLLDGAILAILYFTEIKERF
tara:strand:- start:1231 stop:1635 length:405 start_codon:yes stop_codon:yes gene_type:complete